MWERKKHINKKARKKKTNKIIIIIILNINIIIALITGTLNQKLKKSLKTLTKDQMKK